MSKGRVEAFSDGVFAIIITIMVLDLHVPLGDGMKDLTPLLPVFLCYVLSFFYVGIYWNNHHHMFQACSKVSGGVLWANLFLLFWLSLLPFATGWMGENHFTAIPTMLYGLILVMAAISYVVLQQSIIRAEGPNSVLKDAVGDDWKGKLSMSLYFVALFVALRFAWISAGIYAATALIWLIPDRRIEQRLVKQNGMKSSDGTGTE